MQLLIQTAPFRRFPQYFYFITLTVLLYKGVLGLVLGFAIDGDTRFYQHNGDMKY